MNLILNFILDENKVWSEKKFTHVFHNYDFSVCPIWKIVLLPKNIEIENSKMVSQAYIVLKMSPTDAILMKNENCNFTKFVNFFISQFIFAQKFYERLGIASIFFRRTFWDFLDIPKNFLGLRALLHKRPRTHQMLQSWA